MSRRPGYCDTCHGCLDPECHNQALVNHGCKCKTEAERNLATAVAAMAQAQRDLAERAPVELTAAERKTYPVATGLVDYFPRAMMEIAHVSWVGNEQHNPGTPLHWDRTKSQDEADALMRHFIDRGTIDTDGTRHSAKLAWRALALLEKELEAAENA